MQTLLMLLLLFSPADKLEPKYKTFLEHDAFYLITESERKAFIKLDENELRDLFIEQFWRRRDLFPDTVRNEYQEEFLERLEEAEETWGFHEVRTRFYALFGPPHEKFPVRCTNIYVPIEIWRYRYISAFKGEAWILFYQPNGFGPYRLWDSFDQEWELRANAPKSEICFDRMWVNRAITWTAAALNSGDFQLLTAPPQVDLEDLDDIFGLTTYLEPGIEPITFSLDLTYKPTYGPKVEVRGEILVSAENFSAIDMVGEIMRGSSYVDRFHYRYQYQESDGEIKLPAEFIRFLYPGDYRIRLRLTTPDGTRGGRVVREVTVPSIGGVIDPESFVIPDIPTSFALTGPDLTGAVTGFQVLRVPALPGIEKVSFLLNGGKVLTCNRPPFTVELDLGDVPVPHVISAEGYDSEGELVKRDSLYLNAGVDLTAVHIVTPIAGDKAQLDTPFKALIFTTEKDPPKSLKIFMNDNLVSEIFQPPYEFTLHPPMRGTTIIRALLETESGKKIEDVSMLNAGTFGEVVRVNVVNLYVTVTSSSGRPVLELDPAEITVLEDGEPQTIEKIELAETVPLRVAVAVDTSGSMEEHLPDVQDAARTFLSTVMKEGDEALVVDFDTRPRLVSPLSDRRELLYGSLTSLFADGSTALYDAVIFSLYRLQGSGRKAMVLLTDGRDTTSRYSFDKALDYARRAGVVIYPIALKVRFTDMRVRNKLMKLAEATGGRFIAIENPEKLKSVYEEIAKELRTQYRITYTSKSLGREFRTVTVEIKGDKSARTIAGYYP